MLVPCLAFAVAFLAADEVPVERFLVAGPVPVAAPAFAPEPSAKVRLGKGEVHATRPLPGPLLADLEPHEGMAVPWPLAGTLAFRAASGELRPEPADHAAYALLAASLQADRFAACRLEVSSFHRLRVHVDGKEVASRGEVAAADATERGVAGADLELAPGPHRVLIEAWYEPGKAAAFDVRAKLVAKKDASGPLPIRVLDEPARRVTIADYLDTAAVDALEMSSDGERVIVRWRKPEVPAEHQQRWSEVRDAGSGAVLESTRGAAAREALSFVPGTHDLAWIERAGDAATLWVARDGGAPRAFVRGVKELIGFRFLPGGDRALLVIAEKEEPDDDGLTRVRDLNDRRGFGRRTQHLWIAAEGGALLRLTAGEDGIDLLDVSPDGKRVLLDRLDRKVAERPYSTHRLMELDLRSQAAQELLRTPTLAGARYVADGAQVLVHAGPSFAGLVGSNLGDGVVPNDYDGELYLLTIEGRGVSTLTLDFAPSVAEAEPFHGGRRVLLRAEVGDELHVFDLDLESRSFHRVETGCEATTRLATAAEAAAAAAAGSSALEPERVFVLDRGDAEAAGGAPLVLATAEPERWERIRLGEVEDVEYVLADGTRIEGRVHFPPGLDRAAARAPGEPSWPLIFYYYGGTSPIDRSFGGRYPLNLWAAHGYVVLTVNPSGATGYGQEFSARHVNDWGARTSGELLEALDRFLADHPAVDRGRVGCIGASFGGFMTMTLLTKTDRFAAAISHAGISAIGSYWGQGAWGYEYSAIATADSFPWNRPDIYVERSPLFSADRIRTPLLLLHGDADNNVPVGESEQMYVALKLLGKDVEYVRVAGENHHVLSYPKRTKWMATILAYFDWRLKGQPEWWRALHGE